MQPENSEFFEKDNRKYFREGNSMRTIIIVCTVLIVATLAVYMQSGNYQFVYDDKDYVTNNLYVASGITGENIRWAFTSTHSANWHPITWLSHMADVQLFGMDPRGHHLTNVVIHTVSSLLLLLLLFRVTGSPWQSSFVAALFALHPLHVESVAWVAERKDVLSAFFWFLTLFLYSEYAAKRKPASAYAFSPHPHPSPPPEGTQTTGIKEGLLRDFLPFQGGGQEGDGVMRRSSITSTLYLLCLISFVLGLMSKPMLVTLPLVMLLLDFWPLDRYRRDEEGQGPRRFSREAAALVREKIPFFACSLFSGIVTIYAQHAGGATASLDQLPFLLRAENALIAYPKYMIKTLWPRDLAVLYPMPSSFPLWQVIGALLVLLIISAAAIRFGRRFPYLPVGWFWFLITLLPVIGLLQVGSQSMADRYMYIPVIGLFIMAAWGIPNLTKRLQHRKIVLALLAGVVIIASAAVTWRQLGYWRDNISLYRHTLQVTSGNYLIVYNLGHALAEQGDLDGAIQEYLEALRIKPDYGKAHSSLGIAFTQKGNLDAAIHEYREALRINPYDAQSHSNLGIAFAQKGDLDSAIHEFQEAVRINPDYMDARNNLEFALVQKRMQAESRK